MPLPAAPKKLADTVKATRRPLEATTKSPGKKASVKETSTPAQSERKAPKAEVSQSTAPHPTPRKVRAAHTEGNIPGNPKLFVLDTNVLLHDPTSLFRFEEHDVFLPMTTLEELDNNKKGTTDIARNARQASRWIDQLIEADESHLKAGCPLDGIGNAEARGRLFFQTRDTITPCAPSPLLEGKPDNAILLVLDALTKGNPQRNVVLVSKDINMRIKAAALGLAAEDYFNDKAIDDARLLYCGNAVLSENFWEDNGKSLESWQAEGRTFYRIAGPLVPQLHINEFVHTEDGEFVAQVCALDAKHATLRTVRDFTLAKNALWGIHARNIEQSFALNLLTDSEIDLVTILGHAGTGKTLMTLAAALTQTFDEHRYSEIIFTRATVSVGEDIGYLPGTEEEKMAPWMGALEDNLEVLMKSEHGPGNWRSAATSDIIRNRIRIKSMSFMRGRTFLNKFLIIDEAQNLSPQQMKTLVTRAGPGTKVVCLGNIAQIDTPYLTEGSSGLTYLVDRSKSWEHAGHITLSRGERSRLALWASETL